MSGTIRHRRAQKRRQPVVLLAIIAEHDDRIFQWCVRHRIDDGTFDTRRFRCRTLGGRLGCERGSCDQRGQ